MNDYVHIEAADLCRPNARFTQERQGYQVLTLFGKLGYSQKKRSEPTGRDPQRDRGASEQGIQECLGWRHVPFTARHGGNADPEGGLDPGQDVAVGAVARATTTELGLKQGRILQGAGQEVG